ncbi:MAG: chromate efflux transporter [Betaproteobacteria bacterium]|nr:chromate efflux transporter [Betaproteobacteria bacterium]
MSEAGGPIRFADALAFWAKLGFISFGGPAGQIAIMHRELVERHRWVSERRFLHALNYCMVLPGPEAQQLATYLGWLMHGTVGGIAAGVLFVLPSFFILGLLSWGYLTFGSTPFVAGLLAGVKPAVVAIVIAAVLRIASRAVRHPFHIAIAIAAFLALAALSVPFPIVIAGAALAGIAGKWIAPSAGPGGTHAVPGKHPGGPALIDDDSPTPAHARPTLAKFVVVIGIGLALGLAPCFALVAAFGSASPFVAMAGFFTQAALVTFGGAYAVLPYLVETAVSQGWATAAQMIDGLALGETTPGPLIMIVTFVGFLGGWAKVALGPESLLAAGWMGAAIATWFTFLPSFVFILAGGPYVERTRGELHLERPLAAITAAVVGVIANLALFFGWHVLLPRATAAAPFSGGVEWAAVAITVAATVALVRHKAGVIPVIAASAVAGLALAALR